MSTSQTPDTRANPADEKSGRLGPLNPHGLDLDAEERRQKRDKGTSSVVTIVISVLVFLTAAVFYILHARAVDRNQTPVIKPSESTIGPSTPPATANTAATAGSPTANPTVTPPVPVKPVTPPTTPPVAATPPDKSAKEPAKEPAKATGDAEPKKHKAHHKSEDSDTPHALPRLPLPPPTE
jgi:hypothetical protein